MVERSNDLEDDTRFIGLIGRSHFIKQQKMVTIYVKNNVEDEGVTSLEGNILAFGVDDVVIV